jgi:hypothetical protein
LNFSGASKNRMFEVFPYGDIELSIESNSETPSNDYYTNALLRNWSEVERAWVDLSISSIYEFGCGRGVISIALAKNYSKSRIVGLDINRSCIDVAKKNALNNGVPEVEYVCTDYAQYLSQIRGGPTTIISTLPTLPYISSDGFSAFEKRCLDGGFDGLFHLGALLDIIAVNQSRNGYGVESVIAMTNDLVNLGELEIEAENRGVSVSILFKEEKNLNDTIYTKNLVQCGTLAAERLERNVGVEFFNLVGLEFRRKEL